MVETVSQSRAMQSPGTPPPPRHFKKATGEKNSHKHTCAPWAHMLILCTRVTWVLGAVHILLTSLLLRCRLSCFHTSTLGYIGVFSALWAQVSLLCTCVLAVHTHADCMQVTHISPLERCGLSGPGR